MCIVCKYTEMQVDAQLLLLFAKGPCEFEAKSLLSSTDSRRKRQSPLGRCEEIQKAAIRDSVSPDALGFDITSWYRMRCFAVCDLIYAGENVHVML